MKTVTAMGVGVLLATMSVAFAEGDLTGQDISNINALLANMKCQMDDEDIEKTATGFELDDVFCADGQYDMTLNVNFEVIDKKAE